MPQTVTLRHWEITAVILQRVVAITQVAAEAAQVLLAETDPQMVRVQLAVQAVLDIPLTSQELQLHMPAAVQVDSSRMEREDSAAPVVAVMAEQILLRQQREQMGLVVAAVAEAYKVVRSVKVRLAEVESSFFATARQRPQRQQRPSRQQPQPRRQQRLHRVHQPLPLHLKSSLRHRQQAQLAR